MDIVVATYNEHKLHELMQLFPGHTLLSPRQIGLGEHDIPEDGSSYVENALFKARYIFARTGKPTLADDSGLSVAALQGAPGIKSARFGSQDGKPPLSSSERNALLVKTMDGVARRDCAFVCALAFVYGEDRCIVVQETCPGLLLAEPRGDGGFGYDPLVFLPELGKSMAELAPDQKNSISHRGRAARRLLPFLSGFSPVP